MINTPSGKHPRRDEIAIRSTSWARRVPIITTIPGALASVEAIGELSEKELTVRTLQEYTIDTHGRVTPPGAGSQSAAPQGRLRRKLDQASDAM